MTDTVDATAQATRGAHLYRMPSGAHHVPTKAFTLAQTIAGRAVDETSIAGFFGDPGTGKTHALRYFAEHTDVPCIYVTASPSPQAKEIFEEILLGAGRPVDNVTTRELRRDCEAVLAETRRALIIDESQHLSNLWHQQLRSLHDRYDANFALLLVGGVNAQRTLQKDPQLWSRVELRVEFTPLEGQELLNVLHAFHPVLANTDDDLLLDIDRRDCRGNFRDWSHVLKHALTLLPATKQPDRLTEKVVRAVFAMRGTQ